MAKIELGDTVIDLITGFRGVVVAHHEYLHGCERFSIQPEKLGSDKKPIEPQTFDEPQLKLVRKNSFKLAPKEEPRRPGGPQREPSARVAPLR